MKRWAKLCGALLCGCAASGFGAAPPSAEPLVMTQNPRNAGGKGARDLLDQYYLCGSRVVLAAPPWSAPTVRVLSEGLYAAGSPAISYDGQRVYFTAKTAADSDWQIYEAPVVGGHRRVLTSIAGGAASPALLPDSGLVFSAPVPKLGHPGTALAPQLFSQFPGVEPHQLSFAPLGTADPTVLPDGRILFASAVPAPSGASARGLSLFTINNDGTELTAFACQHDPPAAIRRPKLLAGGRLGFVAGDLESSSVTGSAECVRMARPFLSRAKLLPNMGGRICSLSPDGGDGYLVCAEDSQSSWAVYRVATNAQTLGSPLFQDPKWDCVEAVAVGTSQRPMGRISNMDFSKNTGRILCVNANDTTIPVGTNASAVATRIRVLGELALGGCRSLGEVPVQEDGSFMAEVPADLPLGFEALDQQGRVLRRIEPMVWVRPGENRSCTGCHAAHNRAPHNHRPLAVYAPVPVLRWEPEPSVARTGR